MGAAVAGVLAVDERGDVLAIGIAVAEDYLDVVAFEVDGRIERLFAEVVVDEVQKAVLRAEGNSVEHERKAFLEVGVVLDHRLHIVHVEGEVSEHLLVWQERNQGAVLLFCRAFVLLFKLALDETCRMELAIAVGTDEKLLGKGIDSLGADAVETDRLLESLVVELAARVEHADSLDYRPQRNASAVVAHGDLSFLADIDGYLPAEAHRKLVYRVVDDFLEHHVDTVVLAAAVSEPSYIHTGPHPDVHHTFESPYVFVCVVIDLFLGHLP